MPVRWRSLACLAVLVVTAGCVGGCSPARRGNLGVTVDDAGRIIGVIALCEQDRVEQLTVSNNVPTATRSHLTHAPSTNPREVVLLTADLESVDDPGPDWHVRGPGPDEPAPVTLEPGTPYADTNDLSGLTTDRGFFDEGGTLPDLHYQPRDVLRDAQLRKGWVLDAHRNVTTRADFEASQDC